MTTLTKTSIEEVKRQNINFFSAEAMRYFNSRVESDLFNGEYFITSEQCKDYDRMYTVRKFMGTNNIDTISEFNTLESYEQAKELIESLVVEGGE